MWEFLLYCKNLSLFESYYEFKLINVFIYLYRFLIKKAFKMLYKVIAVLNTNRNLLKSSLKLIDKFEIFN